MIHSCKNNCSYKRVQETDCNGCDISEIFHSNYPHEHSDSAHKIMLNYRIGYLKEGADDQQEKAKDEKAPYPKITETTLEYKDGFVVDRTKGVVCQVLSMKKKDYLEMIHNPVQLPICRLFDTPFVEFCSRNKPATIISIWFPVLIFLMYLGLTTDHENKSFIDHYLYRGSEQYSNTMVFLAFVFGILMWSHLEYFLHRFLFHSDGVMPDNGVALWFHFMLHGVHHMIPMDKDRLVFPPGMGVVLFGVVYSTLGLVFHGSFRNIMMAGLVLGYIFYDCFHYFSHHMTTEVAFFKGMKKYHIRHHYVDGDKGYGITTKLWDYIYGTVLE